MKVVRNTFLYIFMLFIIVILCMNVFNFYVASSSFKDIFCAVIYLSFVSLIVFYIWKTKNIEGKKSLIILLSLIVMGFIIRLLYAFYVKCEPISDYETMRRSALYVAKGDFSPFGQHTYFHRFVHMTNFTLVCGFLFKLFGTNIFVVKLVSIIISCLCIYIMYLIGKKLSNERLGLTISAIYTFFIPSIAYTSVFTSENFAMPFLLMSLYFVINAYKKEKLKNTIIEMLFAGIFLALGCLFRGVAPFYLCAYVIATLTVFAKKTKLLGTLSLLVAFFTMYNAVSLSLYHTGITSYKLTDGDVPFTIYMLVGFNFETGGMFSAEDQGIYYEVNQDKDKMAKVVKERLIKRIKENPHKIIPLMFKKTNTIYGYGEFNSVYWSYDNNGNEGEKPNISIFYRTASLYYIALLILTLYGLVFTKKKSLYCIFALMILGFEAGLMLMEVQPRYTYSVAYVFVICASMAICEMKTKPISEIIKKRLINGGKKDEKIS